jgi:curved DNA-binding protein CbpA
MGAADPDPYAVLGVPRTATPAEVTQAYRRLVRRLHPDTGPPAPGDEDALRRVLAAYEVLHDPERRARYDARTRTRAPAEPARPVARPARPAPTRRSPDPWLLWVGPVRRHEPPPWRRP